MDDTSPTIKQAVRDRVMTYSGAERMEMGAKAFDAARSMVIASFPSDLSAVEFRKKLFSRIYGPSVRDQLKLFDRHIETLDRTQSFKND